MEPVQLDRNESQYGPAPACFSVLSRIGREQLSCYTRDYDRGVKSRVSERLAGDLGVNEKDILLGYGAELLLKMAIHRYARPGRAVLVPDASWWYYTALSSEVGATSQTYPVVPDGDCFRYDDIGMRAAYDEHSPAVVIIATPNNPTGNSMPLSMLRELLDYFRDAVVIVDEAYWGYSSTDNSHVAALQTEFDNVILIRSFSKYYALAGLRMGYAVIGSRFQDFAAYTTLFLGYQQIAEEIVLAALGSPAYYTGIARRMEADKQMFYNHLQGNSFLTCYRSDANFLLFRMHPAITPELKQRLGTVGIKAKFFTEPRFIDHLRLTLGTSEQNLIVLREMIAAAEKLMANAREYPVAV